MSMGEHLNLLRAHQTTLCKHFNHYVELYNWSTHGDLGSRSSGVKLIALVIMHIEQNTPELIEHQKAAVREFFESNDAVKNSADTDAVFQELNALIRKWQADGVKISKKNLPMYIQILEAASVLFSFHKKSINQQMIDRLHTLAMQIKKESPSKLVNAYTCTCCRTPKRHFELH
jgi:outer membrane protein OmpA-like peptidoglycan-associated protein